MSTSTLSSDFECDIISIDDHQMNAMIRSDGCNSIEIEFDQRSSGDESSPRKLSSRCSSSSEFCSPIHNRKIGFRPIGGRPFPGRSLFSDALYSPPNDTYSEDEQFSATLQRAFNIFEKPKPVNVNKTINVSELVNKQTETAKENTDQTDEQEKTENSRKTENEKDQLSDKESNAYSKKKFFKGSVCLTQDLGDEGIFQVTLPGHRVSIADITLDDELAKSSSNLEELLEFISEKPENNTQTAQIQSQESVLVC